MINNKFAFGSYLFGNILSSGNVGLAINDLVFHIVAVETNGSMTISLLLRERRATREPQK